MSKKQAIKCFVFIIIFVILFIMVSYVCRTNGEVKNRFNGFYALEKNSVDVMMFGSSACSRSFSPGYMYGKTGVVSYALASNSQRGKAVKELLNETYKYQSPQLVIVELRGFIKPDKEFASDEPHIREVVDNMRYSLGRVRAINNLSDGLEGEKLSLFIDIIKYHSNWSMLFIPSEIRKLFYSMPSLEMGYEPNYGITHDYFKDEWKSYSPVDADESQEKSLIELLDYLDENNQKALFVTAIRFEDDEYCGITKYLEDIITSRGYSVLNLNYYYDEMEFVPEDSDDGVHANVSGAAKCSEFIGEYVKSNFNIADRRDDTTCYMWEQAYSLFQEHLIKMNQDIEESMLELD